MDLPRIVAGERRRQMALLIGNGLAQAGQAIVTALLLRAAFDQWLLPLAGGSTPGHGFDLLLALVATALLGAWLRRRERIDAERLGQDYIGQVRVELFDVLSRLAPRVLQRRSRGGVLLRFIGDLTALRQWVSLGLARLLVAGVAGVGALAALALIDYQLALGVAGVLLLGGLAAWWLGRQMESAVLAARRRRVRLSGNLTEKLSAMAVVQAFGQRRRERGRVEKQSRRLQQAMVERAAILGGLRAITEGTTALAGVVVLAIGGWQLAQGQGSVGTLIAAMAVLGLLVPPLRDLGRVHEYWHAARVSQRKIHRFLNMPGQIRQTRDALSLRQSQGHLAFEQVRLNNSLHGISLQARPGQHILLRGSNGAGKSSLLSLALRLHDPDGGAVRLDGHDIRKLTLGSLRGRVGLLSPDLPLLAGSLRDNICYRRRNASDEALARVIELCELQPLIDELPDGLNSRIREGGANLSVGQRARVQLARVLLGQPAVLLLDEADANLDEGSRELLYRIVADYPGTVLLISHDERALAVVDRVWELADGKLLRDLPAPMVAGQDATRLRLIGG